MNPSSSQLKLNLNISAAPSGMSESHSLYDDANITKRHGHLRNDSVDPWKKEPRPVLLPKKGASILEQQGRRGRPAATGKKPPKKSELLSSGSRSLPAPDHEIENESGRNLTPKDLSVDAGASIPLDESLDPSVYSRSAPGSSRDGRGFSRLPLEADHDLDAGGAGRRPRAEGEKVRSDDEPSEESGAEDGEDGASSGIQDGALLSMSEPEESASSTSTSDGHEEEKASEMKKPDIQIVPPEEDLLGDRYSKIPSASPVNKSYSYRDTSKAHENRKSENLTPERQRSISAEKQRKAVLAEAKKSASAGSSKDSVSDVFPTYPLGDRHSVMSAADKSYRYRASSAARETRKSENRTPDLQRAVELSENRRSRSLSASDKTYRYLAPSISHENRTSKTLSPEKREQIAAERLRKAVQKTSLLNQTAWKAARASELREQRRASAAERRVSDADMFAARNVRYSGINFDLDSLVADVAASANDFKLAADRDRTPPLSPEVRAGARGAGSIRTGATSSRSADGKRTLPPIVSEDEDVEYDQPATAGTSVGGRVNPLTYWRRIQDRFSEIRRLEGMKGARDVEDLHLKSQKYAQTWMAKTRSSKANKNNEDRDARQQHRVGALHREEDATLRRWAQLRARYHSDGSQGLVVGAGERSTSEDVRGTPPFSPDARSQIRSSRPEDNDIGNDGSARRGQEFQDARTVSPSDAGSGLQSEEMLSARAGAIRSLAAAVKEQMRASSPDGEHNHITEDHPAIKAAIKSLLRRSRERLQSQSHEDYGPAAEAALAVVLAGAAPTSTSARPTSVVNASATQQEGAPKPEQPPQTRTYYGGDQHRHSSNVIVDQLIPDRPMPSFSALKAGAMKAIKEGVIEEELAEVDEEDEERRSRVASDEAPEEKNKMNVDVGKTIELQKKQFTGEAIESRPATGEISTSRKSKAAASKLQAMALKKKQKRIEIGLKAERAIGLKKRGPAGDEVDVDSAPAAAPAAVEEEEKQALADAVEIFGRGNTNAGDEPAEAPAEAKNTSRMSADQSAIKRSWTEIRDRRSEIARSSARQRVDQSKRKQSLQGVLHADTDASILDGAQRDLSAEQGPTATKAASKWDVLRDKRMKPMLALEASLRKEREGKVERKSTASEGLELEREVVNETEAPLLVEAAAPQKQETTEDHEQQQKTKRSEAGSTPYWDLLRNRKRELLTASRLANTTDRKPPGAKAEDDVERSNRKAEEDVVAASPPADGVWEDRFSPAGPPPEDEAAATPYNWRTTSTQWTTLRERRKSIVSVHKTATALARANGNDRKTSTSQAGETETGNQIRNGNGMDDDNQNENDEEIAVAESKFDKTGLTSGAAVIPQTKAQQSSAAGAAGSSRPRASAAAAAAPEDEVPLFPEHDPLMGTRTIDVSGSGTRTVDASAGDVDVTLDASGAAQLSIDASGVRTIEASGAGTVTVDDGAVIQHNEDPVVTGELAPASSGLEAEGDENTIGKNKEMSTKCQADEGRKMWDRLRSELRALTAFSDAVVKSQPDVEPTAPEKNRNKAPNKWDLLRQQKQNIMIQRLRESADIVEKLETAEAEAGGQLSDVAEQAEQARLMTRLSTCLADVKKAVAVTMAMRKSSAINMASRASAAESVQQPALQPEPSEQTHENMNVQMDESKTMTKTNKKPDTKKMYHAARKVSAMLKVVGHLEKLVDNDDADPSTDLDALLASEANTNSTDQTNKDWLRRDELQWIWLRDMLHSTAAAEAEGKKQDFTSQLLGMFENTGKSWSAFLANGVGKVVSKLSGGAGGKGSTAQQLDVDAEQAAEDFAFDAPELMQTQGSAANSEDVRLEEAPEAILTRPSAAEVGKPRRSVSTHIFGSAVLASALDLENIDRGRSTAIVPRSMTSSRISDSEDEETATEAAGAAKSVPAHVSGVAVLASSLDLVGIDRRTRASDVLPSGGAQGTRRKSVPADVSGVAVLASSLDLGGINRQSGSLVALPRDDDASDAERLLDYLTASSGLDADPKGMRNSEFFSALDSFLEELASGKYSARQSEEEAQAGSDDRAAGTGSVAARSTRLRKTDAKSAVVEYLEQVVREIVAGDETPQDCEEEEQRRKVRDLLGLLAPPQEDRASPSRGQPLREHQPFFDAKRAEAYTRAGRNAQARSVVELNQHNVEEMLVGHYHAHQKSLTQPSPPNKNGLVQRDGRAFSNFASHRYENLLLEDIEDEVKAEKRMVAMNEANGEDGGRGKTMNVRVEGLPEAEKFNFPTDLITEKFDETVQQNKTWCTIFQNTPHEATEDGRLKSISLRTRGAVAAAHDWNRSMVAPNRSSSSVDMKKVDEELSKQPREALALLEYMLEHVRISSSVYGLEKNKQAPRSGTVILKNDIGSRKHIFNRRLTDNVNPRSTVAALNSVQQIAGEGKVKVDALERSQIGEVSASADHAERRYKKKQKEMLGALGLDIYLLDEDDVDDDEDEAPAGERPPTRTWQDEFPRLQQLVSELGESYDPALKLVLALLEQVQERETGRAAERPQRRTSAPQDERSSVPTERLPSLPQSDHLRETLADFTD